MKVLTYFDVAGVLAAKHPVQVVKLEMKTNAALAAGAFWQVHDFAPSYNKTAPANGAVPLKSWPAAADAPDYKEFKHGELSLANGLYVCISTTEATLTLGTGSNKFSSLSVELTEADLLAAAVAVEDSNTKIKPWATGARKKLVRVWARNSEAVTLYLMLFAHDAADGDRPLETWRLAANGSSGDEIDLGFGEGRQVGSIAADGTEQSACWLKLSTTPDVLTETVGAGAQLYTEKI